MESLSLVAIFTVVQIGIIVVVEKYFAFEFFTGLAIFIVSLGLVISVCLVAIYYLVPFRGGINIE